MNDLTPPADLLQRTIERTAELDWRIHCQQGIVEYCRDQESTGDLAYHMLRYHQGKLEGLRVARRIIANI